METKKYVSMLVLMVAIVLVISTRCVEGPSGPSPGVGTPPSPGSSFNEKVDNATSPLEPTNATTPLP
ncbi:hypothetical protein SUGI_0016980 [Cryptomeria japonica]|nr:hypothetical protein SUGI_0016980 [Cryptomeria japonica]